MRRLRDRHTFCIIAFVPILALTSISFAILAKTISRPHVQPLKNKTHLQPDYLAGCKSESGANGEK